MPHTITIKERRGRPGHVYYPLQLSLVSKPTPGPKQLLVKIEAAALNHRDLFIRQNLYPDISCATVQVWLLKKEPVVLQTCLEDESS